MYAVIFRAEIAGIDSEYRESAEKLRKLAIEKYGCREFVSASEGNAEIAISYWDSKDQIREWKQDPEHLLAQAKGKENWYHSYSVEITEVQRSYNSSV